MSKSELRPFYLWTICFAVAACMTLTAAPVAAEEMIRDRPFGDKGRGDHGGGGMGPNMGIGIGLGIGNELLRQQGAGTDDGKHPSEGKAAKRKTESKKTKRAAKKDEKKPPPQAKQQQETTDKPPPTKTTDKPPVTQTTDKPPVTQTTDKPPVTQTTDKPPVTQTTDKPPVTQTTDKPPATQTTDKPPVSQTTGTPPSTNTPTTQIPSSGTPPSDGKTTSDKTAEEDCPQRGKGCIALILDFYKDEEHPFGDVDLIQKLKNVNCDVEYVAPKFNSIVEGNDEQNAKAKENNASEMKKVNDAIARHRERLEQGVELAIEMLSGHGNGTDGLDNGTFGEIGVKGSWSTYSFADPTQKDKRGKAGISRGLFHGGNYKSANKHVCSWFVFDGSCFSGYTPRAVDTLNNTGAAAYTVQKNEACPLHAGYERDYAIAASDDGSMCINKDIHDLTRPLLEELEKLHSAVLRETKSASGPDSIVYPKSYRSLGKGFARYVFGEEEAKAYYADGGYHYCGGPFRRGYSFSPAEK